MFRALDSIHIGAQPCCSLMFILLYCLLSLADYFFLQPYQFSPKLVLQVFEAIQQSQDDLLINSIIDEVMEPQLRQVIFEAWHDVADVNRSKQVKKVTDITCILPSPSPPPPLSILHNTRTQVCIFMVELNVSGYIGSLSNSDSDEGGYENIT